MWLCASCRGRTAERCLDEADALSGAAPGVGPGAASLQDRASAWLFAGAHRAAAGDHRGDAAGPGRPVAADPGRAHGLGAADRADVAADAGRVRLLPVHRGHALGDGPGDADRGAALAAHRHLPGRVCPARHPHASKPVLDLLAAIPSVVYGIWGVVAIVPWVGRRAGAVAEQPAGVHPALRGEQPHRVQRAVGQPGAGGDGDAGHHRRQL